MLVFPNMMTLAERLHLALKDNPKKTQAGLARACKIKPPSVNEWFSGRTKNIESTHLFDAARYLNVSPEWLGSGKGEMRPRKVDAGESLPMDNISLSKRQIIQFIIETDEDKITPEKIPLIEMTIEADKKNVPTLSTVTYAINHPAQPYNTKNDKKKQQNGE
jgi:transcriptional regulator with XRE-family HTH domain